MKKLFSTPFRFRQRSPLPYRPMNIHDHWMVLCSRISFFCHFHFLPVLASLVFFMLLLFVFKMEDSRFHAEQPVNDWHPLSRFYAPEEIKSLYQLNPQTSWVHASTSPTILNTWFDNIKPDAPYAHVSDDPEINSLDWSFDHPPPPLIDKFPHLPDNDNL